MTPIIVNLPIRLLSEANRRDHWAAKAKRVKAQRSAARFVLAALCRRAPSPPLSVTITRRGKRLLDSDNLAGSAKAVRDGVADWLGIDDGDQRISWRYEQEKSGAYQVQVRIDKEGE